MSNNTSVLDIYGKPDNNGLFSPETKYTTMTSQDYFVHMLRFSKVVDMCKDRIIFDLGCGKHTNLLRALCGMSRGVSFKFYLGVDYGEITPYRADYLAKHARCIPHIDWTNDTDVNTVISILQKLSSGEKVLVTCFEVLEHMDFDMQKKFLANLAKLSRSINCEILFSTPNYNGKAAKNHISEINYLLEEELFDAFGFDIVYSQGLSCHKKFAANLSPADKAFYDRLTKCLPMPLVKMILSSMLDRKYANNILYVLEADKTKEPVAVSDVNNYLHYANYRQGFELPMSYLQ